MRVFYLLLFLSNFHHHFPNFCFCCPPFLFELFMLCVGFWKEIWCILPIINKWQYFCGLDQCKRYTFWCDLLLKWFPITRYFFVPLQLPKGTTNNSNDNKPSTITPTTPTTTYMGDNSLLFYHHPSQHLTRTTSYKSTVDCSQETELTLSQSMDVLNIVEMARIWNNKCQNLWYPQESNSEESVNMCWI